MASIRWSSVLRILRYISYHIGGPAVYNAFSGGRIRIIMYHGAPTRAIFSSIGINGYNIPVQQLEQHLIYLKRRCNVISLSDAINGNRLSKSRTNVVITFDDGYENNYYNT